MNPGIAAKSAPLPSTRNRLCIVHFQRKPTCGHFSVESYFSDVRALISSEVDVDLRIMPRLSRGVLPRIHNMMSAWKHQGDVNHIVGDIHYATTLLDPARTILTVLDCDMLHRTKGMRRALLKLFWFTLPSQRTAAITVISEATRRELLNHIDYPPQRIHVIPVFINQEFRYSPREFNTDLPTILQIGTRHNKNLERLILAVEGLQCRLEIVGILSEEQRRLLAQTDANYQNFTDLSTFDLMRLYERSDILSFVSTLEGFGMPILEAQAVGRPVVTSNCSSMPEVAGAGAVLVDPLSVSNIRAAIRRVITDAPLRGDLVARGLMNAQRFSAERIAKQYCQLYESVFNKDRC